MKLLESCRGHQLRHGSHESFNWEEITVDFMRRSGGVNIQIKLIIALKYKLLLRNHV